MATEQRDHPFVFPPQALQEVFASMEQRKAMLLQKLGNPVASSEALKTPCIKFVPVEAAVSLLAEGDCLYCQKLNVKGEANYMSRTEFQLGLDSFVFSWFGKSVEEYGVRPGKSPWVALVLDNKRILPRSYFTYFDLTLEAELYSEWGAPPESAVRETINIWKDSFLPAGILPDISSYILQAEGFDGKLPLPTINRREYFQPEVKTPFGIYGEDVLGVVAFCEESQNLLTSSGISKNTVLPLFQSMDLEQITQAFPQHA